MSSCSASKASRPGLYPLSRGRSRVAAAAAGRRPRALRFLAVAASSGSPTRTCWSCSAPRFGRTFWKYRNHPKAYRVTILDVGHLSQTLFLSATELGLGAYITAAINEVDIEQRVGLDA
jgi:nitroreductase